MLVSRAQTLLLFRKDREDLRPIKWTMIKLLSILDKINPFSVSNFSKSIHLVHFILFTIFFSSALI